jgi:hypothetical protein
MISAPLATSSASGRPGSRPRKRGGVVLGCVALLGSLAAFPPSALATTAKLTRSTSLASEAIPPPIGYQLSTQSGSAPSSVTPAIFDQWIGAGSSSSFGFVNGYDIVYDSTATNESREVALYRFHSPAEAKAFASTGLSQSLAAPLSPEAKTIHGIKGSSVQVSTTAGSDGFYVVDAYAAKKSMVMEMIYSNTAAPTNVPSIVSANAVKQYKRLSELPISNPV